MRQFEIDYYKQLVEEQYNNFISRTSNIDKEILCRNIISRAYYCSLLHCRNTLPPIIGIKDSGSHEIIIDELGLYYRSILMRLKTQRIKSDYKLTQINTHPDFITKIKDNMEEVLQADQSSLKNKSSYTL